MKDLGAMLESGKEEKAKEKRMVLKELKGIRKIMAKAFEVSDDSEREASKPVKKKQKSVTRATRAQRGGRRWYERVGIFVCLPWICRFLSLSAFMV